MYFPLKEMLFIATSAARVQVSFQQIQLRLCSKYPPLALTHAQSLVEVICISQGTVAAFYRRGRYIDNNLMLRFFGILYIKNY